MSDTYRVFRKFPQQEQALELQQMLLQKGIESVIDEDSFLVDITFTNPEQQQKEFFVKLAPEYFPVAETLLTEIALQELPLIPKDYYLYDFDDSDLQDIIKNPQEWSKTDYLLAKQILQERSFSATDIEMAEKQVIAERETPKNGGLLIPTGYLMSIAGGYLGLLIGILLYNTKRPVPDGRRIFFYTKETRKHGLYMIVISAIVALAVTAFQIYDLTH
ncbi:MAG: hypothetical protein ACT6QS_04595 [Flavobacteriales bacterium]